VPEIAGHPLPLQNSSMIGAELCRHEQIQPVEWSFAPLFERKGAKVLGYRAADG
jgi:hypothetical protein